MVSLQEAHYNYVHHGFWNKIVETMKLFLQYGTGKGHLIFPMNPYEFYFVG